ncbi:type IV secretion system protein VirB10 [Acidocella facilis]|uniref:type IV secretion system protein VirB10 n=1 Tax=Acidocella facilis TaxID=525 RepID=UPI001F2041F7|nr:type IV secretion system protein VirB10 [Acidocella facilis]
MSERLPPGGPPSPVDDGRSPVAGPQRHVLSTGTKFGLMGLVGVLALGFIWFNAMYSHKAGHQPSAQQALYSNGGEQFAEPPSSASKPGQPAGPLPAPAAPKPQFLGLSNQQTPASAPIMAFSGGGAALPRVVPAVSPGIPGAGPEGGVGGSRVPSPDNSPLAARLKPTVLSGERATVMQNPGMVITEGTVIPCTLQTAIDSELPGLVTCVVPINIRGATGNVVLLDAGTKIVGQIENGLLQGQNRVFVDWTRAETPDHVIVTLDSPGTDELGRGGLPGAVNNHFWDRFGGALMLTLVQGGLDAATIEAAGKGNNNSTTNQAALGFVYAAQSNGQSVANTALENTINIPPTLTKNQGETVALIVAHDLDFSDAYRLQINNTGTGGGYGG